MFDNGALLPLAPDVVTALRTYLDAGGRRLGERGRIFRAEDRGAAARASDSLSDRAVGFVVDRFMKRAGIRAKAISPHSLRHTFALRCLRAGGDVVALRKILGHASLQTTMRYVDHLETAELAADLPRLPW